MNALQKAQLALEEKRAALGKLLDAEERGDDWPDKLTKAKEAVTSAQTVVAVAGLTEPEIEEHREDTKAGAELRGLLDGANVGQMFDSVLGGSRPSGQIAELQEHYELESNQIPVQLLTRRHDDEIEKRAVTPAPGDVGQNQQGIVNYVFPMSAAAFLGVEQPTVGVGESVFPVLTSELTVGTPAENAEQNETTGAFSADVLSPSRIQASFFYSREDRARFAGMDAALRENLSMGLADGLDRQILVGTNGLLTGTNLPNNTEGSATTFDNYISKLAFARVDGRLAATTSDVRTVMGSKSYEDAGSTYRNASVDRTALDRLMELTGGVRVSAHVPAAASNKQNAVVRVGNNRDMVAPIWSGISLIVDEVTKAKAGQIVITAVMLHAVKILRQAGYHKQEINVS